MAALPHRRTTDNGGIDADKGGALLAAAVPLCLLHDLVVAAAFLASHPLHAAYLLFFARHLARPLAAFFAPLLASTALLLAVLATVGPYLRGGAGWPSLGGSRTCGIAVAALCAELRPDGGGGGGAGLVAQLCSFVLGPGDAAAVVRVGEIMGELGDFTGSCFVLEDEEKSFLLLGGEECKQLAFELPLTDGTIGDRSFLDHEVSGEVDDEIDDKVVISEDLKDSESLTQRCCQSEALFVQAMEAEEEHEVVIQEQGLISSGMDDVGEVVEEKRLECDPISVEIKKCEPVEAVELKTSKCEPVQAVELKIRKGEPVQAMELEIRKCEPVQTKEMEIKKCEPVQAVEVKEFQTVEQRGIKTRDPVKPRSLIAQRIKLWEAQVSGNFKTVIEDMEDNSEKFSLQNESIKDVKKCVRFEADPCDQTCDRKLKAQDISTIKPSVEQEQCQEFKDVKECVPSDSETFSEICRPDLQAEENVHASHNEQAPGDVHTEAELQEQECKAAQAEQDTQECQVAQAEQDIQEKDDYKDVTESPVICTERENSLKSMSIAGRVHSRTSSENLVSEESPSQKEKEWKRTLACKLYEERMQLKLCRDRAVVEGSDNMDMLWEAYEVGGSSGNVRGVKHSGSKVRSSKKVQEPVEEGEEAESEEQEDEDDEGSVKQLCCLQALKFSTKKMNFGGGRPSLAKISKVLKRMTVLSRVGSRRSQKG
ncbi:hypothetical protein EJB05_27999, partial [Eragrostis curvula]